MINEKIQLPSYSVWATQLIIDFNAIGRLLLFNWDVTALSLFGGGWLSIILAAKLTSLLW
jgi:hypothetical protein